MKFIILAYNPSNINPTDMHRLVTGLEKKLEMEVFIIQHLDKDADPIYCVQFADTNGD